MKSMVIEMPEKMKEFVEQEVSQGNFQTPSALFQALVADLIRARAKKDLEQSLLDALDEYERGEYTVWKKGDTRKLAEDIIERHRASQKKALQSSSRRQHATTRCE